jgi:hypothetical protein
MKQIPKIILLAAFIFSLQFSIAFAGVVPCATGKSAPCTLCHFIVGFWNIINYGFGILIFLSLVGITIAGIMYILSGGSEKMITTAKTFIKNILTGFALVIGGWLLIFIVMNYFAVQSDLGIGKADGWTKFECSMESSAGTLGRGGDGGGDGEQQRLCSNTPGGECKPSCDTSTESSWSAYKCSSGICCISKDVGQVQCGNTGTVDTVCVSQGIGCPSPNLTPYLANCGPQKVCCKLTFSAVKCGNNDGRCFFCDKGMLGCYGTLCPQGWSRKVLGTDCPSNNICCTPQQ